MPQNNPWAYLTGQPGFAISGPPPQQAAPASPTSPMSIGGAAPMSWAEMWGSQQPASQPMAIGGQQQAQAQAGIPMMPSLAHLSMMQPGMGIGAGQGAQQNGSLQSLLEYLRMMNPGIGMPAGFGAQPSLSAYAGGFGLGGGTSY